MYLKLDFTTTLTMLIELLGLDLGDSMTNMRHYPDVRVLLS